MASAVRADKKRLHERTVTVACSGYASGSSPYGLDEPVNEALLSRECAESVCGAIHSRVGDDHVEHAVSWHAGADPVATNLTAAGRAMNRRVEVSVTARGWDVKGA